MNFSIFIADPADPVAARAIVDLFDNYASGINGGGLGLPEAVKENLPSALAARPGTHVVLAMNGRDPVGLVISFE